MSAYTAPNWTTSPINPTCEYLEHGKGFCGKATDIVYPAHGNGWMALCFEHGHKHLPHAFHIENAIKEGETFEGLAQ
jgi:hypothetical protein